MRGTTLTILALASLSACMAQSTSTLPPAVIEVVKELNPTNFIGEGRLSHAPEYIELEITVSAECYPTPLAASQSADAASTKIVEFLETKIDKNNAKDGVFSSGGYSQPFSRYTSDKILCEGSFQKTSMIVMKSSRVAAFPGDFDEIQAKVFATLASAPNANGATPITYASIGMPTPQLYHETREALEQQALGLAVDNAKRKLEASFAQACGQGSYRILRLVENSVDAGRPIAYGRSQPSSSGDAGTSIEFDAIWINKLLSVDFVFEAGDCGPK